MMATPKFYITDVFAFEKYSGNQLATFVDCERFDVAEMQKIAREINFAETTFITSREKQDGGYNVRIFTPKHEMDFAGHPTLGTAFIINKYLENGKAKKLSLNLKVGPIPVTLKDGKLWMLQNQPVFGERLDRKTLAKAINVNIEDIEPGFPVQEVSTGLPFIVVPLKNMDSLKKVTVNGMLYSKLIKTTVAKAIVVFSPEAYQKDQKLSARMFAPYFGVPEDPATGSAIGCLAAYVLKHNYFGQSEIDIKVGQGYEIGRPSELLIRAGHKDGKFDINVGGKVVEVAEGVWR